MLLLCLYVVIVMFMRLICRMCFIMMCNVFLICLIDCLMYLIMGMCLNMFIFIICFGVLMLFCVLFVLL